MFSEVPYISIDRVHIMVSTVQFSEKMIKSLKSQHNIKGSPYLVNTRISNKIRGQRKYAIVVPESKTEPEAD